MKTLSLVAAALFSSFTLLAQNYCGFDSFNKALKEQHQKNQLLEDQVNDQILDYILSSENRTRSGSGEILTIPVVVHIIHDNGSANIPDESVFNEIDFLNQAFANFGDFEHPDGTEIGIQFCLAQRDPDNNPTNGINRVVSDLTDVLIPTEDLDMKNLSRWDPTQYMNMWVVREITAVENNSSVLGYGTYPTSHGTDIDGIVVEAAYIGTSFDNSSVTIHEAGHYLGLFHTFENGCPNGDCLFQGDKVCDTPPDEHTFNTNCDDGTNSCDTDEEDTSDNNPFRPIDLGGLGDQIDDQLNYMDYTSLACMDVFTPGQSERMIAALITQRSSLLDGFQCLPPCEDLITVDISLIEDELLFGESAQFANFSENFETINYFVNGVFETDESSPEIEFDEPGTYSIEVILENSSEGCGESISFEVSVTCPIDVSFTYEALNFEVGGMGSFISTSTGGDTYEWIVNEEAEGSADVLDYTFDEAGTYSIYLVGDNGECQAFSDTVFAHVGLCNSGYENNQWLFFTTTADVHGFNFNEGEDLEISTNNFPGMNGHCRSSICDQNGNHLMTSSGSAVYNQNFEIMENGGNLDGDFSSHYGTSILKKPGSISEYYVFYTSSSDAEFVNGLTYSIVDMTLDGGLGAVTDVKNIFVELTGSEGISTINHCNGKDFWVIFYDIPEGVYKSYLVTEEGVAEEAVISDLPDQESSVLFSQDLRVNPRGDLVQHWNYLMSFDQETGELELLKDFELATPTAIEFSPDGNLLYIQHGDLLQTLSQYQLNLGVDLMIEESYDIEFADFDDLCFDMRTGPDGKIYLDHFVGDYTSIIENPNVVGPGMNYISDAILMAGTINSYGNFHHGYVYGDPGATLLGQSIVCVETENIYEVHGLNCIEGDVTWIVDAGSVEILENGQMMWTHDTPGTYMVTAEFESECGFTMAELEVEVVEGPVLDLGPDMPLCEGESLELDAGDGFDSYVWQDGSSDQTFDVNSEGTYTVFTYGNSCFQSDEVNIEGEVSGDIDLGEDVELCDSEIILLEIEDYWADPVWQDGTSGSVYTVYEAGTYVVTVNSPCPSSDEIVVTYCEGEGELDPAGVEEFSDSNLWSVYPNPSNGNFSIESPKATTLDIMVFSSIGQLVLSESNIVLSSGQVYEIDAPFLAEGIYEIVLLSDRQKWVKKLVVSK